MPFPKETREERNARLISQNEESRLRLLDTPEVKRLIESGQAALALKLLGNRKRRGRSKWDNPETPLDLWIYQAVRHCLAPPNLAETMTAKQRRDHADAVEHHCASLWDLLTPFLGDDNRMGWYFQPNLDYLALELSIDFTKDRGHSDEEAEEIQHRSRFAMYYLLMDRMEDVLATLAQSAEQFAATDTIIKKPNDANAKRLYFLRVITKRLCAEFKAPCRGVAIALASAFFDCTDLDEASVSKLAPAERNMGAVEIPLEQLQGLVKMWEERIAAIDGLDPEKTEELEYYLNFYRELIAKSSA